MRETAINGHATIGDSYSYTAASRVYVAATAPVGNLDHMGNRPVYIDSLRLYLGGGGTCQLFMTDYFGNDAASPVIGIPGPTIDIGFQPIGASFGSAYGQDLLLGWKSSSGTKQFGKSAQGGRTIVDGYGNYPGYSLSGSFQWYTVPTAPQNLRANADTPTQVSLAWDYPYDDGGGGVSSWYVEASTAASFSSTVIAEVVTGKRTWTGLTAGQTLYWRVSAINGTNGITQLGYFPRSQASNVTTSTTGAAPTAPQSVALTPGKSLMAVTWAAPADLGGLSLSSYTVDIATNSTFTTGLVSKNVSGSTLATTFSGLIPGVTYYVRVKATNAAGTSPASATASDTVLARTVLDLVLGASVSFGGYQIELRSDGAATPTVSLVATDIANVVTTIATLPVGTTASTFSALTGLKGLSLAVDTSGNLYVTGVRGDAGDTLFVKSYTYGGGASWAAGGTVSVAMPSGANGDPISNLATVTVPGTPQSLFVLARRNGSASASGNIAYATLDLAAIAASSATPLISSDINPSFLGTAPSSGVQNVSTVDVAALTAGGTRFAIVANGYAVVDVAGGVVTGVSKAAAGTASTATKARVVGVSASAFMLLVESSGALSWTVYGANGASLGSGTYAAANFFSAAAGGQWDAFYDRVANVVTVYYLADTAVRQLESIDVSPVTFLASAPAVLTSALGPASSTNTLVRVPAGAVDERRVTVGAANLSGPTPSLALYADTSGNVAPNAPSLTAVPNFDATTPRDFTWTFSDPNALDAQTAYQLVIEKVADGTTAYDSGKVTSSASLKTLAASTLTNATAYRWKVRTYDALGTAGPYSGYSTFTPSSFGTLTITDPAADGSTPDTSFYLVKWTYTQVDGYAQAQRRVRATRLDTGAVVLDTTMQANATLQYNVTGLLSDVAYRIDLDIINTNGQALSVSRTLTPSFASPMPPTVGLVAGDHYITVIVGNPTPSGSRPEVVTNYIERRAANTGDAYARIGSTGYNGIYIDREVASNTAYEYRAVGSDQ